MELIYGSSILVLAASCIIYILPMMIAFHRRNENYTSIFVLNLLLGWTIVVWVVCLVWAFVGSRYVVSGESVGRANSKYDELERLADLRARGALTPDEFDREKSRILK